MDPRTQGGGMEESGSQPNAGVRNQQETDDKIIDRFKPDTKGDQSGNLNQLSLATKDYVKQILELAPAGRERATALTNLEQCFFWLNASVSRNYHV